MPITTTQHNKKELLRDVTSRKAIAEIVLLTTYIAAYQQQQEDKGRQGFTA
jgi:hypothetical protein